MPGLRQPLSAHIQQIRNDLRERYKDGFPILKELLQNADDAGGGAPGASASEMVLLLAPGIPNSRHVLLQTPGFCLVNDGDYHPRCETLSLEGTLKVLNGLEREGGRR
jgi:hypothetical protein